MKGRLGIYDKKPFDPKTNSVEGVEDQATRFRHHGGNRQQERMIRDKRRSLDRAVWNSYQAAEVVRVDAEDRKPVRALINPNKLKQDYDDKIISVGYEYNFKCGDVFEWMNTNTFWLIYLQDLTELAYFRGDIRKCSYKIAWEDGETYVALKGPMETRIDNATKHNINFDSPNYSLTLLIPKNEKTEQFFVRYREFYLQGHTTCWRVEVVDSFSTPGILEVTAVEYFANKDEDDIVNGVVGSLIEEPKDPNEGEELKILGETFIKVKQTYQFKFRGSVADVWSVDPQYPVKLTPDPKDPRNITLVWDSPFSGQFDLHYGNYSKTIVVESLF